MTTSEKFVKDIQNNDGELSDGRIIRFGIAVDPDYVPLDPDKPDPAYIHQQDRSYADYIVLTHEQLNKAKHDMIHGDDSLIPSVRDIHHLIRALALNKYHMDGIQYAVVTKNGKPMHINQQDRDTLYNVMDQQQYIQAMIRQFMQFN